MPEVPKNIFTGDPSKYILNDPPVDPNDSDLAMLPPEHELDTSDIPADSTAVMEIPSSYTSYMAQPGTVSNKSEAVKAKKQKFLGAYRALNGNLSFAAEAVPVAKSTIYKWLHNDKTFAQAVDDINTMFDDVAETWARKRMLEGRWKAVTYWLENKCRHRGWVGEHLMAEGNIKLEVIRKTVGAALKEVVDNGTSAPQST